MTSTLIHYTSLPDPPPLLLTSSLHPAHASLYPSHSSPCVTQSSSPIARLSHFISLQSSFFLHSFLPFFRLLFINALLMMSSISLKFHSLVALFFLPLPICPFLFSHSFSSLLLSSLAGVQSERQNGGRKWNMRFTVVGATQTGRGIPQSADLTGAFPHITTICGIQRERPGKKNSPVSGGKRLLGIRRSEGNGRTGLRQHSEDHHPSEPEWELKETFASTRLKKCFTLAPGREQI